MTWDLFLERNFRDKVFITSVIYLPHGSYVLFVPSIAKEGLQSRFATCARLCHAWRPVTYDLLNPAKTCRALGFTQNRQRRRLDTSNML